MDSIRRLYALRLMAAACELKRSHGIYYAAALLEDHGISLATALAILADAPLRYETRGSAFSMACRQPDHARIGPQFHGSLATGAVGSASLQLDAG